MHPVFAAPKADVVFKRRCTVRARYVLLLLGLSAGCTTSGSSVAPSVAGPGSAAPDAAPIEAGTTEAGALAPSRPDGPRAFRLPIRPADAANQSFGLNPFGIHIADHGSDGHPGFDFEYTAGAKAYAAADGTVDKVLTDVHDPTKATVQLAHTIAGKPLRTVYTNVAAVDGAIVAGAPVVAGQILGTPGTVMRFQGGRNVQYAMIHFQVDDFSKSEGLTNPSAISPEGAFTDAEGAALRALWERAAYEQEVCEPFMTNPRGTTVNPTLARTWTGPAGASPGKIEISCTGDGKGTTRTYRFLDAAGAPTETGTAKVEVQPGGLTFVDFTPGSGPARAAVYVILDLRMTIAFAAPGGARPATLDGASVFTTSWP